jgi:outer membrane receptor protein involved in Fe transport
MNATYLTSAIVGALVMASGAVHASDADNTDLDPVVVTASRSAQHINDVPSSIQVVDAKALDNTVGLSFLDLLKKNASVDVIQYPNGLAGIGLRGMRPDFEFSINPHTLVLVDGRPSGSSSFTTISPESIDHVEVLKGPASALYGASASGGVVNIITKRSTGPVGGAVSAGYGSFGTYQGGLAVGGSLSPRTDFDLGVGYVDQSRDFSSGYDKRSEQEYSHFHRLSGKLRVGSDLNDITRLDVSVDSADLSNQSPGAQSFTPPSRSANQTDRTSGDVRLRMTPADHDILAVGYLSRENYNYYEVPVDAVRFRESTTTTRYKGVQLQDNWSIAEPFSLTYGVDWQRVEADNGSYNATGAAIAPYSPNESRDSKAIFAEGTLRLLDGSLIVTAGARNDWIESRTLATPVKTNFTPGRADYRAFDPRGGIVYKFNEQWRLHASAGRAFVPADGSQIAGQTVEFAGTQERLTIGNQALRPERNTTYDFGVGFSNALVQSDVTYFDSRTRDRIASLITEDTPALRVSSYINADRSRSRGIEGSLAMDTGLLFGLPAGHLGISSSATRILEARDSVSGVYTPVRNVANWNANLSVTVSNASDLSATLTARYDGTRYDTDNSQGAIFTDGKGGLFPYSTFTVFDLSTRWDVTAADTLGLQVSNLFNKGYYEKADYPMPGRATYVRYTRKF